MRYRVLLFCVAVLACVPAGCGTVANVMAPPPTGGFRPYCCMMPDECGAFGGTGRSLLFGGYCLAGGVSLAADNLGKGGLVMGTGMMGAGVVALAVDTPLSFVGDVLTLPVVRARRNGAPWATWWGQQAQPCCPIVEPTPAADTPPAPLVLPEPDAVMSPPPIGATNGATDQR